MDADEILTNATEALRRHLGYGKTTELPELLELLMHQHRGVGTELAEIHDILAEALGFEKAPTLEEDPNCPCPGDWITGDHTAVTLAMQASRMINNLRFMNSEQQKTIQNVGRTIDELRRHNRYLTSQVRKAIRESN